VLHEDARVLHDSTVENSVVGRGSVVRPDVMLTAYTLIGPDVTVPSGTRMSSGRMPAPGE
jgi:UDP-3-O-[3-hydroxymyristoyl] glucosamine N-acyltransferase